MGCSLFLSTVAQVSAQQVGTMTWNGSTSGDWSDPANWTLTDGFDVLEDGLPSHDSNLSELVEFHAAGAGNLNTFLSETMAIGALHFNSEASSTVTIGGLIGGDTPVRLNINGSHSGEDFYPIDLLVPDGQHHRIEGAQLGPGAGNNGLFFDFQQVWQIGAGGSLDIAARIRQANNSRTSYEKTGEGLLILSAHNGGSGGWSVAGSSNPIQEFLVSQGTLQFAADGARGGSANSFTVASGPRSNSTAPPTAAITAR